MASINTLMSGDPTGSRRLLAAQGNDKPVENLTAREAFQDFVAGTFYQQMLKSLHATHGKPAYFHGGQAEEMFQSQMDQQVASDLAKSHGSVLSDKLYEVFARQLQAGNSGVVTANVAAAYDTSTAGAGAGFSANV